jgi:hypothetical protein
MHAAAHVTQKSPLLTVAGGQIDVIRELTPTFAAELLSRRHANQRDLRRSQVRAYAQAMKDGRWRWIGDAIKFDTDLYVIDGQHRLAAIVESGVTLHDVPTITIKDPDAIRSIDQGLPRSLNDMLATSGRETMTRTGAGAVFAEHFGWGNWRGISREEQMQIIEKFEFHAELRQLRQAANKSKLALVGPLSGAIRCMRKNREAALVFFTSTMAMNPLVYGEPNDYVRLLYTWLNTMRSSGHTSGEAIIREAAYKSVRAWNAWRRGDVIKKFQYSGGAVPEAEP